MKYKGYEITFNGHSYAVANFKDSFQDLDSAKLFIDNLKK